MTRLPEAFLHMMQELLGTEEYPAFLASYERPSHTGLRVNSTKISTDIFSERVSFPVEPVPWIGNGFFCGEDSGASRHPWYYGGVYYIQEPSAMTPASLLPVEPGDRVLDLCAAPGGKATELAAKLKGRGVLLANDISVSRAKGLLRNLERFGIANMAVCSEKPEKLLSCFPGYFDKILVDAPCSGEGMFRRRPDMAADWEERGPSYYSSVQKELILQAADMLRHGGCMLYSTCTFSPLENEDTVEWLLKNRPDFELIPTKWYEGFSHGRGSCHHAVRIFPHRMEGEGHFAALLRKREEKGAGAGDPGDRDAGSGIVASCLTGRDDRTGQGRSLGEDKVNVLPGAAADFLASLKDPSFLNGQGQWRIQENRLYYLPDRRIISARLRFLRTGLLFGEMKKSRFEPSQALAMALRAEEYPWVLDFAPEDERTLRYLKGETVVPDEVPCSSGWVLVCAGGLPLGWGKTHNGMLKNKYGAGWRML